MAFSFPGLSWLLMIISWLFLIFRFWQSFKRTKTEISKYLFYFASFLIIPFFLGAINSLFFADNFLILRWALIIALFFNTLSFASLSYLLFLIKFPQIPTKLVLISLSTLILISLILSVIFPPHPIIGKGLNDVTGWNLHPLPGLLYLFFLLITVGPMTIIFLKQSFSALYPEVKIKSLGLGLLCLTGILAWVLHALPKIQLFDIIIDLVFSGIVIFITFFTQKPSP